MQRERRSSSPLNKTRRFIHDHFAQTFRLPQLADMASMPVFSFIRAFGREYGLPPHAYKISVRLKKAEFLLRSGVPAAQVAAELGFADQSHFVRQFRKSRGITPSAYARLVRQHFSSRTSSYAP
jgi:AraC-like DNA-binding protein